MSPAFVAAIDWALAVRPKDRPQSLALWRDVLEGRMAVPSLVRSDATLPSVAPGAYAGAAGHARLEFEGSAEHIAHKAMELMSVKKGRLSREEKLHFAGVK